MMASTTPDLTAPSSNASRAEKRRFNVQLWALLAASVVLCLAIAALTTGDPYDMESARLVRDALGRGALDVYSIFAQHKLDRWPYPPALFPWIYASGLVARHGGPDFVFMIRVPIVLADVAVAWLVQDFLAWSGRSHRFRLAAAALVALGPSFVVIAGYHGQFDAIAILPGVWATSIWVRRPEWRWRALIAGVLIGLGADVKTVPILLLLALLPTVRSKREAGELVLAAALPLVLSFAPFVIAGTLHTATITSYRGRPGVGGISLLVQPNLAEIWLGTGFPSLSSLSQTLMNHGTIILVLALVTVVGVGLRSRPPAHQMAALLWVGVLAFGVDFFFQYLMWGLPFLVMCGYLRSALLIQLGLLVPTVLFYLEPWHHLAVVYVYVVMMTAAWLVAVGGFVVLGRQLWGRPGGGVPVGRPPTVA
jgi:hypothetical protein